MRIVIFAPQNAHLLELAGTHDVFDEAVHQSPDTVHYDLQLIGEQGGPIRCASGLQLLPDGTIADPDQPIDTLLVVGPREPVAGEPSQAVIDWLRRRCPTARRYGSVCTGAFLLAAAGLLDRHRVTTHWNYVDRLAAACPSAIIEPDAIFVRDGKLFTSAGVTAGIDLALSLVEEDFGRGAALAVARHLVMYLKRPGGQSQFSVHLTAQISTRPSIQHVLDWVRENVQADLSLGALARRAAMSERNFTRVFRAETGLTPADFVEAARIDAARRLLAETTMSVRGIARQAGFASADTLRRAFLRRLGLAPLEYRTRFGSTASAPGESGGTDS